MFAFQNHYGYLGRVSSIDPENVKKNYGRQKNIGNKQRPWLLTRVDRDYLLITAPSSPRASGEIDTLALFG